MAFEKVYEESLNDLGNCEVAYHFELGLVLCISEGPHRRLLLGRNKNCVNDFDIMNLNER